MAMKLRSLLGVLPLMATAGCLHEPDAEIDTGIYRPVVPAASGVERQITVTKEDAPAADTARPLPPSSRDRVQVDRVPFRIGAGYGALSHVDLAVCRERGLPGGYVHVRATFANVGYVVRASVGSATEPPPPALDCIAETLRQVGVPEFEGDDATLSKTYWVGPLAARTEPSQPAEATPAPAVPAQAQ
jgi:hypothetical protein